MKGHVIHMSISYKELLVEQKKTNELLKGLTDLFKEQKADNTPKPQVEALKPTETPKKATTLDILLDNNIMPSYLVSKEKAFIEWVENTRNLIHEKDFLRVVRLVGNKAKLGKIKNPRAYLRTSLEAEVKKVKKA